MILMICANFPPEPVVAASLTFNLATALSEMYQVTVLTPKPSRPFGFSFKNDVDENRKFKQIILQSYVCSKSSLLGRFWESYSFGKHVSRYIKQHRNEINFVYICSWPLISEYEIVREVKKFSIPSILHVEDIYPESLSNKFLVGGSLLKHLLLPIDIYVLNNVSKIIAVSENMNRIFIQTRGVPGDKIEIIQNWQDEHEFIKFSDSGGLKPPSDQDCNPFTFMYLGNIGPVAGVDFLIECFAKAQLSSARLVIAGSGSKKKECMKLALKYNRVNIEFWDVPFGKVPEIQAQADVMVLPLKRGAALSSVPSKLIAYLFSKKPVIACAEETSDTSLAIKRAGCGWVQPPENMEQLVNAFQKAISLSKNDLESYGINGFNYAVDNYSQQVNLLKFVHVVREVAGTA